MKRHVLSSNSLFGEAVHTRDAGLNGQLEDVLLDIENARIAYAVISFDGLHGDGQGKRLIVVPWEVLHMDLSQGGDGIILDADRERLLAAPAFDRANLPNFADPQFASGLYRHYGIPPYWERGSGATPPPARH